MNNEKLNAPGMNLLKLQRYQHNFEDSLIRLGTRSWESAKLCGTLYDHGTPIDEFLKNYASQYDSAEYHDSFLDIPSERKMIALREEVENVNKDFKFCPLVPRRISHEFQLGENPFDLKEFLEAIEHLGPHLGPCILRLPETFSPLQMKHLDKFYQVWPKDKKLAIQFTHADWFRNPMFLNLVAKDIEQTNVSILIEDRLDVPVDFSKLITSDHLIIRLFGRLSEQDEARIAMWVYRLGEYRGLGVKNSFFFLYEHEEVTLGLLKKMALSIGGNVRVPQSFDMNSKQMGFSF